MHHVIPRERGGNNSFNNLLAMHQQLLNPWWARY
ncbi:HNH endonuclease signature motif containing protein [Bacillus cabrialesii subsp. cabrialesii]